MHPHRGVQHLTNFAAAGADSFDDYHFGAFRDGDSSVACARWGRKFDGQRVQSQRQQDLVNQEIRPVEVSMARREIVISEDDRTLTYITPAPGVGTVG